MSDCLLCVFERVAGSKMWEVGKEEKKGGTGGLSGKDCCVCDVDGIRAFAVGSVVYLMLWVCVTEGHF